MPNAVPQRTEEGKSVRVRPALTTIGSLPPLSTSPEEAIRKAVEMQRSYGIELFTDGEQRGDMLSLYASLPGIRPEAGLPRIVGRIRPPEDPAEFQKIHDLDLLLRTFPELKFKVSLTGPTTFAFSCASSGAGPAYKGAADPVLHDDLTEAIRVIAHEVASRDVELQIDDPILSQGMRDYGPALDRLDAIAAEMPRERASLHVCGGLARGSVLGALLRLRNVSTLNLAFAGRAEQDNMNLLTREAVEDRDITLGVGCIAVQVTRVEEVLSPAAVSRVLANVCDRVGTDRVRYALPDCGLRGTPLECTPLILANLREGFDRTFR